MQSENKQKKNAVEAWISLFIKSRQVRDVKQKLLINKRKGQGKGEVSFPTLVRLFVCGRGDRQNFDNYFI